MVQEEPRFLTDLVSHIRSLEVHALAISFEELFDGLTLFVGSVNLLTVQVQPIRPQSEGPHLRGLFQNLLQIFWLKLSQLLVAQTTLAFIAALLLHLNLLIARLIVFVRASNRVGKLVCIELRIKEHKYVEILNA